MAGEVVVMVSCPASEAEQISQTLVQEGLVACVNIMANITSVYQWKGEIVKEQESLLVIKSSLIVYDRLEARIKELHSYEIPEIICLAIENGYAPYLEWLNSTLKIND